MVKKRPIEFVGIFAGIPPGVQTESLPNVQYQAKSTSLSDTRTTPGFIKNSKHAKSSLISLFTGLAFESFDPRATALRGSIAVAVAPQWRTFLKLPRAAIAASAACALRNCPRLRD